MSAVITHRMVSLAKLAIEPSAAEQEWQNAAKALARLVLANAADAVPDEEPKIPGANMSDEDLLNLATNVIKRAQENPEFLGHFLVKLAMGGVL